MLAVQRDNAEAFETLFRKYIGQVVRFAVPFVGSQARAEEVAQDAFLQVLSTRRRYQPRARFATFLFRIVTNLCLSEARRAEHRVMARSSGRTRSGDEAPDPVEMAVDASSRTGEENVLVKERVDKMRQALKRLPAQQRAAILLARVDGFSYDEVARSLGCSVAAVKSLIHRATVTLRDQLREVQ
ncbi:MAG: hypothetical protein A3J75_03500 [Acidobacteria bacterium RBG_16_68_9]|nr:MAG: hypothetical protein A3J75_03500 [Acidobacteria bacterium RBG_16_68_9]